MLLVTFLRAMLMGFSIAAPVGPIGTLCIRRTLTQGRAAGLATGLGAATADGVYGAIAAFGLTALTQALQGISLWTRLLGGLFLIVLGVRTLRAPAAGEGGTGEPVTRRGLVGAYLSTVGLTLTNPATIVSFLGIFAGLGVGAGEDAAPLTVLGVFLGSAVWWLGLTTVLGALRHRLPARALKAINLLSGLLIVGFGIWSLLSVFGL